MTGDFPIRISRPDRAQWPQAAQHTQCRAPPGAASTAARLIKSTVARAFFQQVRLIEFEWREHAIFLDADADGTWRAPCRHSHFDPHLLASLQARNLGVLGDENQNGF